MLQQKRDVSNQDSCPPSAGFDLEHKGTLAIIEVLVDFAFMFDVVLNFRTTIVDKATKKTTTDLKNISRRQGSLPHRYSCNTQRNQRYYANTENLSCYWLCPGRRGGGGVP